MSFNSIEENLMHESYYHLNRKIELLLLDSEKFLH